MLTIGVDTKISNRSVTRVLQTSNLADNSAYTHLKITPTEYITSNNLGWHEGNVIKYVSRWQHKGGLGDLYKAQDYLRQLIDIHEGANK